MFKWLFKKKGCAKHMNNKLEVIGIDHGWSMMKTISQVFVTGVILSEPDCRLHLLHRSGSTISFLFFLQILLP